MTTTRCRYMIMDTDGVSDVLADAAIRWPGLPPTELRRLVAEGHAALRTSVAAERGSRGTDQWSADRYLPTR